MKLNTAEIVTVIAALRYFQENRTAACEMPHFADAQPLEDFEIDSLCERINCDG